MRLPSLIGEGQNDGKRLVAQRESMCNTFFDWIVKITEGRANDLHPRTAGAYAGLTYLRVVSNGSTLLDARRSVSECARKALARRPVFR